MPEKQFTATLHLLCEESKWDEALKYIEQKSYKARSEAMLRQGQNLWTPLTIACVRASATFLKELIDLAPEAVNVADRSGSLPLHFVACWRRSRDCPEILHLLIGANDATLCVCNQWGQTPLHSAFDSRDFPSSKIVRILLQPALSAQASRENSPRSSPRDEAAGSLERRQAVTLKDRRGRLPLHIACEKGAPYTVVRLLIGAWPEAARVSIKSNDSNANGQVQTKMNYVLPVHQYAKFLLNLEMERQEALRNPQSPPSLTEDVARRGSHANNHAGLNMQFNPISAVTTAIIELLLRPLVHYKEACQIQDSAGYTPLHLACKFNVRYEVFKKLLKTHKDAACLAVVSHNVEDGEDAKRYPLDLLERHRSEVELLHSRSEPRNVSMNENLVTAGNDRGPSPEPGEQGDGLSAFNRKSDMLFSYYPMVPTGPYTCQNSHSKPRKLFHRWRHEQSRINRLESRIHAECISGALSETSRLIWLFWCDHIETETSKSKKRTFIYNYLAPIGRLISSLQADGLWKLTFIKTGGSRNNNGDKVKEKGTFIKIRAANDRTVFLESEKRHCNAKFQDLLDPSTAILSSICEYLHITSILQLRSSCTKARLWSVSLLTNGVHIRNRPMNVEQHQHQNIGDRIKGFVSGNHQQNTVGGVGGVTIIPLHIPLAKITHSVVIFSNKEPNAVNSVAVSSSMAQANTHRNRSSLSVKLVVMDDLGVVAGRNNMHVTPTTASNYVAFKPDPLRTYTLRTYSESNIDPNSSSENNNEASTLTSSTSKGGGGWIMKQYVFARERYTLKTPLHYILSNIHEKSYGSSMAKRKNTAVLNMASLNMLLRYADVSDREGRLPLHYAVLYNGHGTSLGGVSGSAATHATTGITMEQLVTLIRRHPSSLTTQDKTKKLSTPLHLALSSCNALMGIQPRHDTIKSLLWITPGEHACSIKDSDGNLPLHLACHYNAPLQILKELIETYPDAAYRVNNDGELPLHLLVQCESGNLSHTRRQAVQLMCSSINYSPGVLSITPSSCSNGRNDSNFDNELPLHIACEYYVSIDILQQMLLHYPQAARIKCNKYNDETNGRIQLYPLQLLQQARFAVKNSKSEEVESSKKISEEEWNKKEDLLLSYYMHCPAWQSKSVLPRLQIERLKRMVHRIRDEVLHNQQTLSYVSLSFWQLFCTCEDAVYEDMIRSVVQGLDTYHLQYLASVAVPVPNQNMDDINDGANGGKVCLTAVAKEILQKCFLFVGRYELEDANVEYLSADSVVLSGWDYAAVDLLSTIKHNLTTSKYPYKGYIPAAPHFLQLLHVLHIPTTRAHHYLKRIDVDVYHDSDDKDNENGMVNSNGYVVDMEGVKRVCAECNLDSNGARPIVIKFILNLHTFERDVAIRQHIYDICINLEVKQQNEGTQIQSSTLPLIPILATYNMNNDSPADILYSRHIKQRYMTSLYSYPFAIVMPRADKNLDVIWREERLSGASIREVLMSIGNHLTTLHEVCGVVHCDLVMTNVLRLQGAGSAEEILTLTDFDSSCLLRSHRSKYTSSKGEDHSAGTADVMNNNYFPGYKFSGGICPPEMVDRLTIDQVRQYTQYWQHVSNDAKDLKLLTPDDVSAITDQVKVLVEDAPILSRRMTPDGQQSLMQQQPTDYWQESISSALAIMSFDDLPESLASCQTVQQFSTTWNRILQHAELWEKIRPQVTNDGNIYVLKTYRGDANTNSNYALPYDLLPPSAKIDVWSFGCLMFQLCSGGPLFKVNRTQDLDDPTSYAALYCWDTDRAEQAIKRVQDPLAQDLLVKLLVREEDRLENMTAVLRHPYFGSTSNLEALKILEKHEEQQLLLEETKTIPLLTVDTLEKLEHSTEKHCKIVFETQDVVAPTCLMALPYQLKWDIETERLIAPDSKNINGMNGQEKAMQIGQYLLEMNAATARLSFWLAMKKNFVDNNNDFQKKLANWLQRGSVRGISWQEKRRVAKEVIDAIEYSDQYLSICMEMLQVASGDDNVTSFDDFEDDSTSSYSGFQSRNSNRRFNTHKFIKDPMGVAKEDIQKIMNSMQTLYAENNVFLYLIDEYSGVPILARPKDDVYPILIHPTLLSTFLPFMNIACMAKLALDGIHGLSNLLGLKYENIPKAWKMTEDVMCEEEQGMPLIHYIPQNKEFDTGNENRTDAANEAEIQDLTNGISPTYTAEHMAQSCSSVAEFAVLQDVLEKLDPPAHSNSSAASQSYASNASSSSRLRQLESFFRERDQSRTFSGLQRLCDGKGPAIWTTQGVIKLMQDQALQASLESRLKHLKEEWLKREKLQVEIAFLSEQLRMLCPDSKIAADAARSLPQYLIKKEQSKAEGDKAASDTPEDQGKKGKRRRGSWAQLLPTYRGRNKANQNEEEVSTKRRQSWAAFDCPKLGCDENDGQEHNQGKDDFDLKRKGSGQEKEGKLQGGRRRQSFTEFLLRRAPNTTETGGTNRRKSLKNNRKKRQSWSAFSFRNKVESSRGSFTNGKPLTFLEDDNAIPIKLNGVALRERSPSVDSIFRRPSSVEPNSPTPTQPRRRSSYGTSKQNSSTGGDVGRSSFHQRRPSSAYESSTKQNNSTATRRKSWADKLKNKIFSKEEITEDDMNESNNYPRKSSVKPAAGGLSKRSSGRGSWREMFGSGGNNKPRPAPLIDDPDPDEDDNGEYFSNKRILRNSAGPNLDINAASNNVMRLDYDEPMAKRMQAMNMASSNEASAGSAYNRQLADAKNGFGNSDQNVSNKKNKRFGLKKMFKRTSSQKESAPKDLTKTSKNKKRLMPKISRRSVSVPKERPSPPQFAINTNESISRSLSDGEGEGYRVVM